MRRPPRLNDPPGPWMFLLSRFRAFHFWLFATAMTDKLSDLRQTINQLDDDILALVRRRMELAADIIAAKSDAVAYRPGREAEVVKRLIEAAPELPAQLIANIWRQLMTASTSLQNGATRIAVHQDAMAVAGWHFGAMFPIVACDDLATVQKLMAVDGGADFALVPTSCAADLAAWLLDDATVHVIAQTPLKGSDTMPPVWMLGRQPADQVAEETSLIAHDSGTGPRIITREGRVGEPLAELSGRQRVIGVIASAAPND